MVMKTIYYSILILLTQAFFSSCRKCESCSVIYTVEGAALKMGDTVIRLADIGGVADISAERIVSKKNGDDKCTYVTSSGCMNDGLDASLLRIYCTRDLLLDGATVPAGKNLLSEPSLLDTANLDGENIPHILLRAGSGFAAGRYTFILKGNTKEGKDVEDIGWVNWE